MDTSSTGILEGIRPGRLRRGSTDAAGAAGFTRVRGELRRRARFSWVAVQLGALALLGSVAGESRAQGAVERGGDENARPECFRFSFGPWSPPLNWSQAGHLGGEPGAAAAAAGGGGNAAPARREPAAWSGAGADTILILFPTWWPVGIAVHLDYGKASGDTVRGTASAFVADGRTAVPKSEVIATSRSCTP